MSNPIEMSQRPRGMQPLDVVQPRNRYAVGEMKPITEEEIQGNLVAIRTLMLDHAAMAQDLEGARNLLKSREGEIEYLKTSPYFHFFSLLFSIGGTTVSALGTNLVTIEKPPAYAWLLVALGVIIVILAGVFNIFYPSARRLFNREKTTGTETTGKDTQ